MKKVLFVATVAKTHICVFHLPFLKMFKEWGYQVHVAARNDFVEEICEIPYCDVHYDLPFERSPLKRRNYDVYNRLKKIIDEQHFDIIHCHTPVGGVVARLAARKARKHGTKVLYTAHGFHFYKGAPLKNWLLYYPVEKLCARYTDTLITINKEDYELAKRKLHTKRVEYVPGVGIDVGKFKNTQIDRKAKRQEIGVPETAFLLVSVGELNGNKNHEVVIRAIAELKNQNIHYMIAGRGELREYLQNLSQELSIENQVHLLGYRSDVAELYKAADACAFPSIREGLPVSVMEAMASGLPCITSKIRGNVDLIDDGKGGYLCSPVDVSGFAKAIQMLYSDRNVCKTLGEDVYDIVKRYDFLVINKEMERIYAECSNN